MLLPLSTDFLIVIHHVTANESEISSRDQTDVDDRTHREVVLEVLNKDLRMIIVIIQSIERFIKLTTVYKDLYGSYDYYNYLTSFLEPLYELNMDKGRTLYNDISLVILNRLSLLKSSENSTNKEYIERLMGDEIYSFKDLIENIITDLNI